MTLRATLLLLLFTVLTGCVTTGDVNPMRTDKGRDAARDAYIQLGIGYLQQGNTGRAKSPLKKALELDSSNADAHAAGVNQGKHRIAGERRRDVGDREGR